MDVQNCILFPGYVAVAYVVYKCIALSWVLFRCYVLTLYGFVTDLRKYGEWVVVTGATDGIGKQYARQFAKRGFKIVLISRTKEKLKKVQKEIEDEFNVETKIICFNFAQTERYPMIKDVINDLDIGILVNNVGMPGGRPGCLFHECDIHTICDCMHTNMFSDVRMTHMVIKGMLSRQRGAIIHIDSQLLYMDMPSVSVYAPTKSFMEKLFRLLQVEYPNVIEHQLVTPSFVVTNMSKLDPSFAIPTAEEYVASAIRTIGIVSVTCGYWVHELESVLISLLPRKMGWDLMIYHMKKKVEHLQKCN